MSPGQLLTTLAGGVGAGGGRSKEPLRDANRSLVLLLCAYVAWQVNDIDKRLAVVEARLGLAVPAHAAGTNLPPAKVSGLAVAP